MQVTITTNGNSNTPNPGRGRDLAAGPPSGLARRITLLRRGPLPGHRRDVDDVALSQACDAINRNPHGVAVRFRGRTTGRLAAAAFDRDRGALTAELQLQSGCEAAQSLDLADGDAAGPGLAVSLTAAAPERTGDRPKLRIDGVAGVELTDHADPPAPAGDSRPLARRIASQIMNRAVPRGPSAPSVTAGDDRCVDGFAEQMAAAIVMRANPHTADADLRTAAERFRGLSLPAMAREHLTTLGVDVAAEEAENVIALAFNPEELRRRVGDREQLAHATGDFPSILADAFSKTAMRAYREAPTTWEGWCRRGTAPDLRDVHRVRLSAAPDLEPVAGDGEVQYATIEDAGETYTLAEYGQIIPITRKAVINDDLDLFSRVPQKQGRAARRLEDEAAYGQLTNNPTMTEDGKALFHADHGNLFTGPTAGGLPGVLTLDEAFEAMMTQRLIGGRGRLGARPRYLIAPTALADRSRRLLTAEHDPDAGEAWRPNNYRDRLELIATPQLTSGTTWFTAADPREVDTVEVSFLADAQEPQFASEVDFDTEGMKLKVRHTVAARALDFRGLTRTDV